MLDRKAAAQRLAQAVRAKQRVVVFGDYDVDGTTSAALLSGVLEALGADVQVVIADRFAGGYGFSTEALARVLALNPQLVVTCDCGSSDHERLAQLATEGVDAVVVDHHLVPDAPLPVQAFLNPHRAECGFPFKGMCSAGLVFVLAAAVRAELGAKLDLRPYLDLVALGTIADVAPLLEDNRRLVRAGLARLAAKEARPGVIALREVAKVRAETPLSGPDIAFRLAPRLNAPGRLGKPELTLALLCAKDLTTARALAAEVEACNQSRREIEQALTEAAIAQVQQVYGDAPKGGVVAADPAFHPGVVGISAARVAERFGVPAVVVALQSPHGHGSARGPEGFPLYDAIARCSTALHRFGGHQAASGVTLEPEQLDQFRTLFTEACIALGGSVQVPAVDVDVQLGVGPYQVPGAAELMRLEPVGEGNPEPCFHVPQARVLRAQEVGTGHLKLRLQVGEQRLAAFGFGLAQGGVPDRGALVQLVGGLRPDTWSGGDAVEVRLGALYPDGVALFEQGPGSAQ